MCYLLFQVGKVKVQRKREGRDDDELSISWRGRTPLDLLEANSEVINEEQDGVGVPLMDDLIVLPPPSTPERILLMDSEIALYPESEVEAAVQTV